MFVKVNNRTQRLILSARGLLLFFIYAVSFCCIFSSEGFSSQEQPPISDAQIAVAPISIEEWQTYLGDILKADIYKDENLAKLGQKAIETINTAKSSSSKEDALRLSIKAYSIFRYLSDVSKARQLKDWEKSSQTANGFRTQLTGVINLKTLDESVANLIDVVEGSSFDSIQKKIKTEYDSFKKITNYIGPNVTEELLVIRAWKADNELEVAYQVYVIDLYYSDSWRFYNSAYDDKGNKLDFTPISRDTDNCSRYGCSYIEQFGLNVTRQYLESRKSSGISFKASGKSGEKVFWIPSAYIKAILSVVPNLETSKNKQKESAKSITKDAKDKRTPFEKYEGAYFGAYGLCAMTQKLVFTIESAKNRGVSLDSELIKTTEDVSSCIKKGLAEMQKEYNAIQHLVKNAEGKKALKEHYVAAVMHVKETHPKYNEDESDYMERMRLTKRKTDELWVRFEVAQQTPTKPTKKKKIRRTTEFKPRAER